MTSGERQGPALEIVQTRDISAVDKRDLSDLWEKLVWRKGTGRLYTTFFSLWYTFAAFLTVSILMTVRVLKDVEPNLALQLIVAALGFAIFLVGTYWLGTRLTWDRHWAVLRTGNRYTLDLDGLRWSTGRGMYLVRPGQGRDHHQRRAAADRRPAARRRRGRGQGRLRGPGRRRLWRGTGAPVARASRPHGSAGMTELIQSRNANASEALKIMRAQDAAFQHRLAADRGYRYARIAWIVLVFGLLAAFFFASKMHWIPRVSVWLAGPAMFVVVSRIWKRYYSRVCAEIYQECLRGDRRLRLDADGIVISGPGIVSSIPWFAIRDIVANSEWLMIYLSSIQTISFPKAAFEGQDVEAFGAELQRRWHEQQALAGTPA